jgi:hypothetical protein
MLTREAIQKRSYTIWEREGRPHGRDHEHWKLAESELLAELERLHQEAKAFVAAESAPKAAKAKTAKASKPKSTEPKSAAPRKRKAKSGNHAE